MGKTVLFRQGNAKIISVADQIKDVLNDVAAIRNEEEETVSETASWVLECVENGALNSIQNAGIASVSFQIEEESLLKLMTHAIEWKDENSECFAFVSNPEDDERNGKSYRIVVNAFAKEQEDGSLDMTTKTMLLEFAGLNVREYNFAKNKWEEREELKLVHDIILKEGGAKEEFINAFADIFCGDVYFSAIPETIKLIRQNEKLIRLYEQLHGLADFDFDIDKNGNFVALLIPDDEFRHGSAVCCKDGMLYGYQYITEKEDEELYLETIEECDEEYDDEYDDDEEYDEYDDDEAYDYDEEDDGWLNTTGIWKEIFAEKNIKKVCSYIRGWWDHYTKHEVYTIPLSATAVVNTENPYCCLDEIVTLDGARDLTPTEKKNLKELQEHFQ